MALTLDAGATLPQGMAFNALTRKLEGSPPEDARGTEASFKVLASYQNKFTGEQVFTIKVGGVVMQVTSISSKGHHTCALLESGDVKCWGHNAYGELGDNSGTNRLTPVSVQLEAKAISVSAGINHTCAVLETGDVKCWGFNNMGQLGDNSVTTRFLPVLVSSLGGKALSVSAGGYHTCAILDLGVVNCWGYNGQGQLGNNSTNASRTPVLVAMTGKPLSVSAGVSHSCAVLVGGSVQCWGYNNKGQLGDNNTTTRLAPVAVQGLNSLAISVSVSGNGSHSCAVLSDGGVKCWGLNSSGQLGINTQSDWRTAVPVLSLGAEAISVSTGTNHTCAALVDGAVMCWGGNASGQLGDNTQQQRLMPVTVRPLGERALSVLASDRHSCAALANGAVKCWGYGGNGNLGNNSSGGSTTPVSVALP
jgi:alpha-tubulin suppressor-like RCC1 family protein